MRTMSNLDKPVVGGMNSVGSESRMLSSTMFLGVFAKMLAWVVSSLMIITRPIQVCFTFSACLAQKGIVIPMLDAYHALEDTRNRYLSVTALQAILVFCGYQPHAGDERPKVRHNVNNNGKENWYLKKKQGKKLDKWKKKMSSGSKQPKNFKPHFGVETFTGLTSQLSDLAEFANVDLPDDIIRKVEGIAALLINLKDCKSYEHFTSAVFLYIRDFYDTSVTSQVMTYVKDLFENGAFQQQSGDGVTDNWLNILRDIQTNWTLVKGNRAFKQFSKLMSILVTLGLCDASSLTFEIGGFKMFDEKLFAKHMSAFDLADALLGTVTYFVEGAYMCFKTGSLKPLLVSDFATLELDDEYTTVKQWWDLVKNGNLARFDENLNDQEFNRRLKRLTLNLTDLSTTLSGLDKSIVVRKISELKQIGNDYTIMKMSSGTRRAPFAIELFGESNQGKTTFGDQMVDALLTSAKLPTDKEYRAALNPGDKFFSNWTSDKLVAILDDLANEKSDFVERPPTRAIIDICNNQMYYAPKAEIDAKGKCFVEPEVVLVTTNVKDLDARSYSNCPYSVQRRMDLVMTVRCRPKFQRFVDGRACGVDSSKVREEYTDPETGIYTPPLIDDIWRIDLEQAVRPAKMDTTAGYQYVQWNGHEMKNVCAETAIACAIEMFHTHRKNQMSLMKQMQERTRELSLCEHAECVHLKGMCPYHDYDYQKQFGLQTALALETMRQRLTKRVNADAESFGTRIESAITKNLYKRTTRFLERWDWLCLVPSSCLENETFVDIMHWYYKEDLERQTTQLSWSVFVLSLILMYFSPISGITLLLVLYIFGTIVAKSRTKQLLVAELRQRNDALPLVIKNARDNYARALCYSCAGIAALYALSRIYRNWREIQNAQSSLEPSTPEEVQQRDEQVNVWSTVYKRNLPSSEQSRTVTLDELDSIVQKNLLYASVSDGQKTMMANVFMFTSDVMLIPDHYFEDGDSLELVCRKVHPDTLGGKFTTRLCKSASVRVPNTDFRICYTGSGGSFKDLTKYLPTDDIVDHPFRLVWRKIDGEVVIAKGIAKAKSEVSNGTCVFSGGEYRNLSINTFAGMCGAVLMSDTKQRCITGFHLGGMAGTPFGCFGTLTAHQVKDAIERLKNIEGVLLTGRAEVFSPQAFGIKIMTNEGLHPKSPLNYLPEDSQFEYYGSCLGKVTSRSDVRRTPISEALTEVTGVENIWGAPKMRPEWFGWQTCLANASEPGKPFPHALLEVAVKDYKAPLVEIAKFDMWQAQPLSDHENLCGRVGCKFIDSINLNTSVGYPMTGSKRKFIVELEPTKDRPNNREFTEEITSEIARVEEIYKRGERAFTIAKACKKDEVLPVAKEKCRIFYGNPIALTFLIRKYFLPVLRMLQMNPLKSECAVGINCHGPEWDEFYHHALHFGKQRMFGGDYGKYDQKLPSQLLHAALRILIDLARCMGYSDEDCETMAAMSGDVVYSLIAVNGDLVGLTSGTHISGNSLTVILNGICGSLNLRAFFYTQYSHDVPFREAAHMMTYGDDNIGSVSPAYPKFNIKGCSEFLAKYGQVYTMPDKESELREYLKEDEFEFLKRFSVHHPKLGKDVGALLEKSIFKSLHCYLRPKGCPLTPQEACAQNIDGALREWFNHGKEVYELRRRQMKDVAVKCELDHMCTLLDETYEDRVADWHVRYSGAEAQPTNVVYERQSGKEETAMMDIVEQKMAPMKCIERNAVGFHRTFGEIDMIFERMYEGSSHIVVFELKSSSSYRTKGRKQVMRYCACLQILQPHARILGIVVDDCGWHPVTIIGGGYSSWFAIAEKCDDKSFEHALALAILDA